MIKRLLTGGALALGASVLGASVAFAQPANPPARFAGTVTVNGQPAAAGTVVEARVGSAVCGTTTVFIQNNAANYVVDVPAADSEHPGCGTEASTVTLFVNGVQAGSGPWRNFELNNINLVVGAATTPTATPSTPVPTPAPPTTGTGTTAGSSGASPMLFVGGLALAAAAVAGFFALRRRAGAEA
jgi:hypothetical protein